VEDDGVRWKDYTSLGGVYGNVTIEATNKPFPSEDYFLYLAIT
jgi:hypothetical protein